MNLKNKSILITGASRGIGRATAILSGEAGAKVAINYISKEKDAEAVKEKVINAGGKAIILKGDVADSSQAKKIIEKTLSAFGSLDILVNNAAVASFRPVIDEKLADLSRMVDINVKGIINTTYAAVPIMEGQSDGGVIINISSGAGKTGHPNMAVYSATKFAVLGFTQGIGQEVADRNVRVYAVCPGMTATDMTGGAGMPPEKVAKRILEAATEKLRLKPGEDTEIYR